ILRGHATNCKHQQPAGRSPTAGCGARAGKHGSPRNGRADRHAAWRAWRQHRHDVTQPKSGRRHRAHRVEPRHRPGRRLAPRNSRERGRSLRASDPVVATALWAVSRDSRSKTRHRRVATASIVSSQPISLPSANQLDRTRFMDFGAHSIIWTILVGLVIGAIAKLLMPGRDPGGCIITILLGIAGAFVGTWIGRIFAGENYVAGWIMSVVGAMILLLLYRLLFRRGA